MSGWKKVKIGDICRIVKGTTGISGAVPGEYPLVVTAEERKTCSTYQFDQEAVCIPLVSSSGHGKKSLKNVHYQSGKFALGTILCAVIPNNPEQLDARFLHLYLQFYKDTALVPLMKGAANVSLSMKDIATVEIPLPPIEKQRELSSLFITLRENQKKLAAESEKQLEYTKLLRQNILQDAIEGKLTAGWRKSHSVIKGNPDYDAEALFEKIQEGKASPSLQSARRSSAAPSAGNTPATPPFEIPEGWKWVRLGEICKSITDGDHLPPPKSAKGIPFLVISDISSGKIDFRENRFVSSEYYEQLPFEKKPVEGDILYTVTGSYGIPVFVNSLRFCVQRHIGIIKPIENVKNYMYFYLMSSICKKQADKVAWGVAVKTIPIKELRNFLLPLPPLKEQEEIVAKVETLLAKVTELENQIQERKILSEKLAFGIIKENLEEK